MKIDKSKFKTPTGNYITQGLFLETRYDSEYAVYTLEEADKEYEGKLYPSIKRLYLEAEDLTEYNFANTYFVNWTHWQRICANAMLAKHIESWREELEVKIKAKTIAALKNKAAAGDFNAAKWLVDRGWDTKAERKTKQAKARDAQVREKIDKELKDDAARVLPFVRRDTNG